MRETVNTRLPPSVTEVSAIEIPDWSLSRMVPVETASPSVGVASGLAPCGFVSVTVTVSLVSLDVVADGGNRDGLRQLAGREGDGPGERAAEVAEFGRAEADRVVDGLALLGVERAGNREHQVAALGHRGVGNRDHRLVVVEDGAGGNRVAERRRRLRAGALRVRQRHRHGLVGLVDVVADGGNRDGLRQLAGREGDGPGEHAAEVAEFGRAEADRVVDGLALLGVRACGKP